MSTSESFEALRRANPRVECPVFTQTFDEVRARLAIPEAVSRAAGPAPARRSHPPRRGRRGADGRSRSGRIDGPVTGRRAWN